MSNVDDEAKQRALIRSIGLMGLLVFPLGMGLFAIANPLVATLLTEEWQGVAPILAALSLVTALQPIAWAASSYLLSKGYNWALSVQEFIKLGALGAGLMIFGPFGPVWACAGVGVAAATQAAIFFYLLTRDKVPAGQLWQAMVLPLLPCIPMVAAVFGVHYGLLAMGIDRPILLLVAEIITGAVVFVPSAFMLCPAIARDFKELVMSSLGRRKSE
jgi:PST family polysaccharide transporter